MDYPPPVRPPPVCDFATLGPGYFIGCLFVTDRAGPTGPRPDPAHGGPGKQDAIDYAMEEIKQDNRRTYISSRTSR